MGLAVDNLFRKDFQILTGRAGRDRNGFRPAGRFALESRIIKSRARDCGEGRSHLPLSLTPALTLGGFVEEFGEFVGHRTT